MHAVEMISPQVLLTMVIGAILFVLVFRYIFRAKK